MAVHVKRRIFLALGLLSALVVVGFVFVVARASSELVSPARRVLQDYHREWLDQPAAHGLSIERFSALDGRVPCLLVQPDARAGLSPRGTKLRDQLTARGIPLPAFGEIKGTLVMMPGRNGGKEDLLPVAERFCAVGFRCLLPDLPAHGKSPMKICTFGASEFDGLLPGAVLQ